MEAVALTIAGAMVRLARTGETIDQLLVNVDEAQARWKPNPESWSMLEVINHLIDEEREDFRRRMNLILFQPTKPWPAIHPSAWVTNRGYNQRDFGRSRLLFAEERAASLAWLQAIDGADLEGFAEHPVFGPCTAREMLANWLAHDLLHVRQLAELHYQHLNQSVAPLSLDYAGGW